MKVLQIILLLIVSTLVLSMDDRKCWSSTWDDRRNEESLSKFKSWCSSQSLKAEFNGYAAYLSGCGYQESIISCCCALKPWPKSPEEVLDGDEIQLPANSKNLLGQFKIYLANLNRKVELISLSSTLKKMLVGDKAAVIGTALSGGQLSFLSLDKLKDKYLVPMQKTFSRYLPEIGKTELFDTLSKTKGFTFGAKILDKVGFVYGVAIPVIKEQIDGFKNNVSFERHISSLFSEITISYSTVVVSTEAGTAIGAAFFGGGAIPGAIAGFTVGVVIQVVTDGMIKIDGNTPADFIRMGFDKVLMIDE